MTHYRHPPLTTEICVLRPARHKLNAAHIHGAMIVAGLLAALTGSWSVFLFVVLALMATAVISGDIRINKPTRRR